MPTQSTIKILSHTEYPRIANKHSVSPTDIQSLLTRTALTGKNKHDSFGNGIILATVGTDSRTNEPVGSLLHDRRLVSSRISPELPPAWCTQIDTLIRRCGESATALICEGSPTKRTSLLDAKELREREAMHHEGVDHIVDLVRRQYADLVVISGRVVALRCADPSPEKKIRVLPKSRTIKLYIPDGQYLSLFTEEEGVAPKAEITTEQQAVAEPTAASAMQPRPKTGN